MLEIPSINSDLKLSNSITVGNFKILTSGLTIYMSTAIVNLFFI